MAEMILSVERSRKVYRIAVGALFFLLGLCFATWASRIPSIQQQLAISDSLLGVVLFALPAGSMLSLLFSGALVTKYGSKRVLVNALLLYALLLPLIGLATNVYLLVLSLLLFGMAGNLTNIAVNTQAVQVEAKYGRNIMASFHGLWSLAGFCAAGIGTAMIASSVIPLAHFSVISGLVIGGAAVSCQYLLTDEEKSTAKTPLFVRPDKSLLNLGLLAFCCMVCEGAMFDWSGIYFQKVVRAEKGLVGAGYSAFMFSMAFGRFVADWIAGKLRFRNMLTASGLLIASGLVLSVLFPSVPIAVAGFLLVGLGVSAVVPLVYSEAGKSKTVSPGTALTAVSSIGFLGFLAGPPLIGIVAGLVSLRLSFLIIAAIGLGIVILVQRGKQG